MSKISSLNFYIYFDLLENYNVKKNKEMQKQKILRGNAKFKKIKHLYQLTLLN